MRIAISAAIIRNKALLLVQDPRGMWILPGGKLRPGEEDMDCLRRELGEELPGLELKSTRFFDAVFGNAHVDSAPMQIRVYLADVEGEMRPSAEITQAAFVRDFSQYPLTEISKTIVEMLKAKGIL